MPEITSRLSTALADRYRIERRLGATRRVLKDACGSAPFTADGQRFVMLRYGGAEVEGTQVIVVENFFEVLKAKMGN